MEEKRNVIRRDHTTLPKRSPSEHLQNQQQSLTNHSEPFSVLYNCEQDEENRKIYKFGTWDIHDGVNNWGGSQ